MRQTAPTAGQLARLSDDEITETMQTHPSFESAMDRFIADMEAANEEAELHLRTFDRRDRRNFDDGEEAERFDGMA